MAEPNAASPEKTSNAQSTLQKTRVSIPAPCTRRRLKDKAAWFLSQTTKLRK